jgi:hypothetical protein
MFGEVNIFANPRAVRRNLLKPPENRGKSLTYLLPPLSNVSPQTADILSYLMLVIIAIFLISGPVIVYVFQRKFKKAKAVDSSAK